MTGEGDEARHPAGRARPVHGRGRRALYMALGGLMLLLGVIGALLPIMPTTIFLIFAAWCFGRASPRLEAWLLSHPRFGPAILDWREHRAIAPRAKAMAATGMAIGYALFLYGARPELWLAALVALFMVGCATYVLSRPNGPREP